MREDDDLLAAIERLEENLLKEVPLPRLVLREAVWRAEGERRMITDLFQVIEEREDVEVRHRLRSVGEFPGERGSAARKRLSVEADLVRAQLSYDRWWNAAREDQATDRVHRIGQRRVVQVFKLVTEGTLEERIDEIIVRKRELLDRVVAPDDPGVLKSFTREELLALLAPPGRENP